MLYPATLGSGRFGLFSGPGSAERSAATLAPPAGAARLNPEEPATDAHRAPRRGTDRAEPGRRRSPTHSPGPAAGGQSPATPDQPFPDTAPAFSERTPRAGAYRLPARRVPSLGNELAHPPGPSRCAAGRKRRWGG